MRDAVSRKTEMKGKKRETRNAEEGKNKNSIRPCGACLVVRGVGSFHESGIESLISISLSLAQRRNFPPKSGPGQLAFCGLGIPYLPARSTRAVLR